VRARAEGAGRALSRAGCRPSSDITAIWQGFTSLGDAASRRAFLATTRAAIDPGGQTVSARDYLPDAVPIPTLIVWGSRDRMIPAWHAISAQRSIPGVASSCSKEPDTSRTSMNLTASPTWCVTSSRRPEPLPPRTGHGSERLAAADHPEIDALWFMPTDLIASGQTPVTLSSWGRWPR
jgi:hypothetical protein